MKKLRRNLLCVGALASLPLTACSSAPPPPPPAPVDYRQVALRAEANNRLDEPARVVFEWSATEQGVAVRGRGVARLEPPYRARLDLFLPSGQTIATAALVDDDLRIPAGVPGGLIPPARLLWATVGVVRPGQGTALVGGETRADGRFRLSFLHEDGEEVVYFLLGGVIDEVQLVRNGDVVETVKLVFAPGDRYPEEAIYRNRPAFRELRIRRESVDIVESFPPDIWNPGR